MYEYGEHLIQSGKAYVCSLSDAETKQYRGDVKTPGTNSPYRDRSVEENLDLFRRMRKGEFKDGEHVLRAKIDMANANMKMRDPMLYRIRHTAHHMTGDTWCIYPMYDYAHPISDAIEGITHSICTLEFENNRELYDWVIDNLIDYAKFPSRPHQYEFARLNLNYTVMSKRRLLELVEGKHVDGWDDPRLPTIAGMRRRGITPEAIRAFCATVGVAKANSTVDMAQLEFCIRDDLNQKAPRVMAVLKPLKVVIEGYPDDKVEELDASYWRMMFLKKVLAKCLSARKSISSKMTLCWSLQRTISVCTPDRSVPGWGRDRRRRGDRVLRTQRPELRGGPDRPVDDAESPRAEGRPAGTIREGLVEEGPLRLDVSLDPSAPLDDVARESVWDGAIGDHAGLRQQDPLGGPAPLRSSSRGVGLRWRARFHLASRKTVLGARQEDGVATGVFGLGMIGFSFSTSVPLSPRSWS